MAEELQETLIEIQKLKQDGAPLGILKKQLAKATLQFIQFRLNARQIVEENENAKAATAVLKTEVDQHNMQLQGLLYEKNHYNKEIASCNSFRSKYTDEQIGLISENDFQAKAPESLKVGAVDSHKLQCQRLIHEKQERLDLLSQLDALRQSKEAINQVVAGKRKQLDDVQQELSAVKAKAKSVFSLLNLKSTTRAESQETIANANAFPAPLFVLFHQGTAVKEAFDSRIDLAIQGSEKQAEAWNLSTGVAAFVHTDQDAPASKKRRKSEAKAQPNSPSVLQAHPMSVVLTIYNCGSLALKLQFFYLPKLELVTVKAEDAAQQEILGSVFPNDIGVDVPYEAANQILAEQSLEFGAERLDRPYLWAQHMCGLDALPALSPTGQLLGDNDGSYLALGLAQYREQGRFQTIVQSIRAEGATVSRKQQAKQQPPPPSTAPSAAPIKVPFIRKIKTWDEIVAEKKEEALAKAAMEYAARMQNGQDVPMEELDADKDNAAPEEGELPDE